MVPWQASYWDVSFLNVLFLMKQWRHLRIFSNHRGDTGIPLVISPLFKPDKFNSINLSNQFLSFPKNTEFTLNEVIRGGEQSRVVAGPISTLIQNNELEVRMQKYRAVSCHQFLFPSPDRADDISAKGTTFTNTSISLCRVTDTFTRKKNIFLIVILQLKAFLFSLQNVLWRTVNYN